MRNRLSEKNEWNNECFIVVCIKIYFETCVSLGYEVFEDYPPIENGVKFWAFVDQEVKDML
jgi:hypothetical protein